MRCAIWPSCFLVAYIAMVMVVRSEGAKEPLEERVGAQCCGPLAICGEAADIVLGYEQARCCKPPNCRTVRLAAYVFTVQ